MTPDLKEILDVQEWPKPTDVNALHQFLGLASYYRRYIFQFADIASPLHNLTKKGIIYNWTTECENAFATLKEKLTTS